MNDHGFRMKSIEISFIACFKERTPLAFSITERSKTVINGDTHSEAVPAAAMSISKLELSVCMFKESPASVEVVSIREIMVVDSFATVMRALK